MPFAARGRSIGVFEMSWALALLVGAPIVALLIDRFGWRGPFVALAVAATISAASVHRFVADGSAAERSTVRSTARLPTTAWYPLLASASIAAAGLGLFVVSGAWLDDAHGVSTGGLGVIAAMFGALELVSSGTVAGFGDRIGSRRSVLIGLVVLLAGHVGIMSSGDSRVVAVIGLLVFFAGFEFAFVSSLTLVTEAAPEARGRAIGISNACGTVARAGAVFGGGQLYEGYGMTGTVVLSASAAVVGIVLTTLSAS